MEDSVELIYRVEGLDYSYLGEKRLFSRAQSKSVLKSVTLSVRRGEIFGIVGGSGSGKTTLVSLMSGVLSPPPGTVFFDGRDLAALSGRERRPVERRVQMVFQDPKSSFNPGKRIGESMVSVLRASGERDRMAIGERIRDALLSMRLGEETLSRYPSQLSGGQIQRCAVARALTLDPDVLVLDEPVSALDVSVQAGVMNTLKDILKRRRLSALLVAHDLAVVGYMADRIGVLKDGVLVETGDAREIFTSPKHRYTRELFKAIPVLRRGKGEE